MIFPKAKKIAVKMLLALFIFSSISGFIFSSEPVQAQLAVTTVADIPKQIESIGDKIAAGWKIAIINSTQQAVAYFMKKIAYDSAVFLAAGGKGQGALVFKDGFRSYIEDVAGEAAGAAIDSLGKGFGLDLCKIPDVKLDLALRIGLHFKYGPPQKPKCDFNSFKQAWSGDAWKSKYGGANGGFDAGKVFSGSLKVEDSDLGLSLKTTAKIDRLTAVRTAGAVADRTEGGGYKPITNAIDGNQVHEANLIKQKAEANTDTAQNNRDQAAISAAMGSGAYQVLPGTLSLFMNTLGGELLKNFKSSGSLFGICIPGNSLTAGIYGSGKGSCAPPSELAGSVDSTGAPTGRAVAEATFSKFLSTKLDTIGDYDTQLIAQLVNCDANQQGLYNCRMDDQLKRAIEEERNGKPASIAEAMDKGWLNREWKLLPSIGREVDDKIDSTHINCFKTAYCESNIKVLRQLRIFPIGMEIAAQRSNPDHPDNLATVVGGFYNPQSKYYHLVDPNWIVKMPKTRCDAESYGETPVGGADVPDRIKECRDLKTCVGYDKNKQCNNWSYCAREKNTWDFETDPCDPQYASCKAFTNSNNQPVAYLYRTLDTGGCNQDTVGCMPYSLTKDSAGNWLPVAATTENPFNTGIHLNKNVTSDCSANSAGCTAFKSAQNNNNVAYMKKAPDYLGCYDVSSTLFGVQWPQTFSDLTILSEKAKPECQNYAQACIADEVGCQNYYPRGIDQALPITGKFVPASTSTPNDQCDQKCVGYDAYREMPAWASPGQDLTYLVPPSDFNQNSSATKCSFDDVGCESFTNMSALKNEGEKVETFTNLRACIKPDQNKQKNYYVYESTVNGYVLQAYTLVKDDATGAPSTTFRDATAAAEADAVCNPTIYKLSQADANCRQFNDNQGNVFYKMMPNTIVVSDQCTPYRLNSSELAGANKCYGNGEYRGGFCYYDGLPGGVSMGEEASKTCSSDTMVSCREYRGTASNLLRNIALDTFEKTGYDFAANQWSTLNNEKLVQSVESTQANGHSLEYSGNAEFARAFPINTGLLAHTGVGLNFTLSFWIKGSGVNVAVKSEDGAGTLSPVKTVGATANWQNYKFNFALAAAGETKLGKLHFILGGSGTVYLDNLQITQVKDSLYLVKDTIKVDSLCDTHPEDNLPGEALGCSAYYQGKDDPLSPSIFLTNFSFLCRDGAVGCNAFKDTFNTLDDAGARAYNVRLNLNLNGAGSTPVIHLPGKDQNCQIEVGKNSCLVNIKGYTKQQITDAGGIFDDSTYFVPADTVNSQPEYLVYNEAGQCGEADLGCTYAGLQKATATTTIYETTTIKLLPDHLDDNWTDSSGAQHNSILCTNESVGCGDFGGSFFKDPTVTGAKVCKYAVNVSTTPNGEIQSGWFWQGAGTDYNTPCYPDYVKDNNFHDLWSFGDTNKYGGFVGECPIAQDSCTEFIDHADKSVSAAGTSYFFLRNDKITNGGGDCLGQVSPKAGCVSFDDTSVLRKDWNTEATNSSSEVYSSPDNTNYQQASKVPVVPVAGKNDANLILKVTRNRECAEWLQCANSSDVWDASISSRKKICLRFDRCNALPDASGNDSRSNCGNFIRGQSVYSDQVFTPELYTNRGVTWDSHDFDGYSILGLYPLEELGQFNFNTTEDPNLDEWHLAKAIIHGNNNFTLNGVDAINPYACIANNMVCGKNDKGTCINHTCLVGADGSHIASASSKTEVQAPAYSCRAYPEKDSPFPNFTYSGPLYKATHKCSVGAENDDKTDQACDCDYSKAIFGDGSFSNYLSYNDTSSQDGDQMCVGGPYSGKMCVGGDPKNQISESDCTKSNGTCQLRTKKDKSLGWKGVCLERDKSRSLFEKEETHPCLTWLPLDQLQGVQDINNQYDTAGYTIANNSRYCLAGKMYQKPTPFGTCHNNQEGGQCDEQLCITTGEAYCKQFPGFELKKDFLQTYGGDAASYTGTKDSARYYYDFGDSPTFGEGTGDSKPHCGGPTVSGGNCDGQVFDDCRWDCVPDYTTLYPNIWSGFDNVMSAASTAVGCQIGVNIDSTDIVFTNHIWKNKNPLYSLDVKNKGDVFFDNKLNFQYGSGPTNKQFAMINPVEKFEGNLLNLMYCKTDTNLWMPKSDSTCESPSTPVDPSLKNLTYGSWTAGQVQTCDLNQKSADCNTGQACSAAAKSTSLDACLVECLFDIDCAGDITTADGQNMAAAADVSGYFKWDFSAGYFKDFKKVTPKFSLGKCIGATPHPGQIEEVGHGGGLVNGHCEFPEMQFCHLFNGTGLDPKVNSLCRNVVRGGISSNMGTCVPGALTPGACNTNSSPEKQKKDYKCYTNADCYDQICVGSSGNTHCASMNPSLPPESTAEIENKINNNAFSEFQQIFAKVSKNNLYYFDVASTSQKYRKLIDVFPTIDVKTDIRADAPLSSAPAIYPVGACNEKKQCEELTKTGFNVNGKIDTDVWITTNPAVATVQFFGYADPDHMPLRNIVIDWDDGRSDKEAHPGMFRNQRGLAYQGPDLKAICGSDASNFGEDPVNACDYHYFQFYNTYDCVTGVGPNWLNPGQVNNNNKSCPQDEAGTFKDGCCVFQPKIQLTDNWGWCNGTCGGSAGGAGCFNGFGLGTNWTNECNPKYMDVAPNKAYTPFGGTVYVAPHTISPVLIP